MADGRTPRGAGEDGVAPVGPAPAVRPFLVTAGRVAGGPGEASSGRTMPVETQLVATTDGLDALHRLSFEQHDIVAACRVPQSIAEIGLRAQRALFHATHVQRLRGELDLIPSKIRQFGCPQAVPVATKIMMSSRWPCRCWL